ncbi:hypothetical protein LguiA_025839 [Lonicera macranthoides]
MIRTLFRSAARQLRVVSTQTIKPASPTPSRLKHYNLSLMDIYSPCAYMPFVLYYPNHAPNNAQGVADKSRRLKRTLSEILVRYYPLAGRWNSRTYVECNDEGVEFQEVDVECGLSEILEKPEGEAAGVVFPAGLVWANPNNSSSLLVVQLTNFECGGMSIAVCLSHKLADVTSFSTFMNSWAAKMRTNASSEDVLLSPHFMSFPSIDDAAITAPEYQFTKTPSIRKKLVFPNSKIAHLKETVKELGVQDASRYEALTALLYKCGTSVTTANSGFFSPTAMLHAVSMRPRVLPPLPKTTMGNITSIFMTPTRNESENNLKTLVEKIKKGNTALRGVKKLDASEYLSMLQEFPYDEYKFFFCSSLCGMPLYKVDFGWGYPSRVTLGDSPTSNGFILMDTPNGDGVEALVSFEEQSMAAFEQDKEILAFTTSQ